MILMKGKILFNCQEHRPRHVQYCRRVRQELPRIPCMICSSENGAGKRRGRHDGAVTDLTGLFMSESNALAIVASAGTDFSIKLWKRNALGAADLQLMTFSFDHTIILWSPDPGSGGVWLERARLGNVGGEALGFLGGAIGPDGRSVVAHSHQGSLSLWQLVTSEAEDGRWCPRPICGGHFGEVTDIAWEKNGHYLLSVSADQTTRLHAQWTTSNASEVRLL
ncbi:unnamed protein product [Nesidiocoris tenuis]|uniref:Elongator complex protein 2 n=1 Tax=Nesidiocoris tenuis TaxID=355587 RepID=A0A6H5H9Y4_9HEMI|nr:unnamed protein product [Nesidiocoris tenuis]